MKQKIAIVGTGIAGIACSYFLRKDFDLALYEQNNYAGGHTHTITVEENGTPIPIDTGFMVYNEVTYPNLTRFFKELNIDTKPTSMSFSVQHLPSGLEYCGSSWNQLFAQRKNLLNMKFLKMLRQIDRFNRDTLAALKEPKYESYTLKEYVNEKRYGDDFLNLYIVPMSSAVWSSPPGKMLEFPVKTLLRFFHNHGFLGMYTQHPWRTVVGGAKKYVEKVLELIPQPVHLNKKVNRIKRVDRKVDLEFSDGTRTPYDKAILACHADESLSILQSPHSKEAEVLSQFKYQKNIAFLHEDSSIMPQTRRAWASWNFRIERTSVGYTHYSTHYWMNRLQGVSRNKNYFVSLNPYRLEDKKILRELEFEHPLFSLEAIKAQNELPKLNHEANNESVLFCGSYFKYGFHEDGFTSALNLCRNLLGKNPWD